MRINTRTVPEGHSSLERSCDNQHLAQQWPPLGEPLHCRLSLDRTVNEIFVTLDYRATVKMECARCLETYQYPVEGTLSIILAHTSIRHRYPETEGEGVYFFDDLKEEVDISPSIFDEVMISLPMKPLCRQGCPGIETGESQGEKTAEEPIDSRWEALRRLRDKQQ